ncbi:MAG: hypothetical protein H0V56_00695 [Chthoniobacterales bacterium]|nr:hypothetical protein [Chthoniobacterales bacterium]
MIKTLTKFVASIAAGFASLSAFAAPPAGVLDHAHAAVQAIMAVQAQETGRLMSSLEILGTAVGLDGAGNPALVIYVDRDAENVGDVVRSLPPRMRGVGVTVELTDKFYAMAKPGSGGNASLHKAKQTAPIQLGTSGGWRNDLANGYCCGGTLGSLVSINGVQHILSNYHVLEADKVPGGNGLVAQTGDPVIQPGLIDVGCNAANAQNVATLVVKNSLPGSNVDAAIAKVTPGMVATDGSILQIGPISSQTVAAQLRQAVKKSGRTTGFTRSSVSGLNATISVTYDNECAGGTAFTKTFTGQIVITNRNSSFLAGGDSGSLMVEDVSTRPRAVGLLFAGSSTSAIANPINEVLAFLGATMVGQ